VSRRPASLREGGGWGELLPGRKPMSFLGHGFIIGYPLAADAARPDGAAPRVRDAPPRTPLRSPPRLAVFRASVSSRRQRLLWIRGSGSLADETNSADPPLARIGFRPELPVWTRATEIPARTSAAAVKGPQGQPVTRLFKSRTSYQIERGHVLGEKRVLTRRPSLPPPDAPHLRDHPSSDACF